MNWSYSTNAPPIWSVTAGDPVREVARNPAELHQSGELERDDKRTLASVIYGGYYSSANNRLIIMRSYRINLRVMHLHGIRP
jgi:hypothetical protein